MVTKFKVHAHVKNRTFVHEYCDGIPVFEYEVLAPYEGGNVKNFIDKNPANRRPLFSGLKEYLQLNSII